MKHSIHLLFTLALLAPSLTFASKPAAAPSPSAKQVNLPAGTNDVDSAIISHFENIVDHSRIAGKCLNCHPNQFRDVSSSIHGKAGLLKTLPEGSLCLTCHEMNHIVKDPLKIQNFQLETFSNVPHELACMRCHADATVAKAFGFPPHVPSEYEQSIHYRKAAIGEAKAPLCFDCHGAHNIVRVENPSSPVHEAQRVKVCAQCHPGANATFASVFDHTPIGPEEKPLEYWVIVIFKILTLGTFMALGLFILLDVMATIRQAIMPKSKRPHEHAKKEGPQQFVERLPFHLRLQHFLMLSSVITLVITAWPLLSPESSVSQALTRMLGGAHMLAMIHRTAGFIMIGDFIYHVVFLYLRFRAGGRFHPMTPMPKDIFDLKDMIFFFFGLRDKRPDFDQFAFHEKFDYWAVFWGVAMMGGSGLVLTFPTVTAHLLPGWAIKLSNIIHADEALLAAMVLFIWHFYNVHLKPGIFPMNWAWLTGRMKKDLYEHEHAGHVEKLRKQGKWKD